MKLLLLAILTLPAFAAPLHSDPLANAKLYLDFTTVPATMTPDQQSQTWADVSRYFARWNIDVTNVNPGIRGDVGWMIVGGTSVGGDLGGEAGGNTFHAGIIDAPFASSLAGYVYADALGNDPATVAMVTAHEFGHVAGLSHELSGIMEPRINLDAQWTAADVTYFDGLLGVVPEPSLLVPGGLFLLGSWIYLFGGRRQAAGGN